MSIPEYFSHLWRYVLIQLGNINVTDVVDILLLSLLLFVAIRFLRERQSAQILVGIVVWVALCFLCNLFQLYAIANILGSVAQYGWLVLIVIFQPEVRAALTAIANEPWHLRKFGNDERRQAVSREVAAICEAVVELSRSRTGALIVIERATALGEVVRSGVEIDAKLSPYLLRNIFFNRSPLHDGAVIVRDARICAAGCLLPLTQREDIDPDLGTRHRAAIGMCENSDAVVVVVSEETGNISVACGREFTRDYNHQSLEAKLQQLLGVSHAEEPSEAKPLGARGR